MLDQEPGKQLQANLNGLQAKPAPGFGSHGRVQLGPKGGCNKMHEIIRAHDLLERENSVLKLLVGVRRSEVRQIHALMLQDWSEYFQR